MSLFRKYGESLLDQPIGIEESRVRQAKEAESRGTLQDSKRHQRVARRAYRQAMRDKNYGGAMKALDWIDEKAGGMDPGIMGEGVRQGMAQAPAGNGLFGQQEDASTQPRETFAQTEARKRNEIFGPSRSSSFDRRVGMFDQEDPAGIRPSLNSPTFESRLASFGNAGVSLFDRYNSSFA